MSKAYISPISDNLERQLYDALEFIGWQDIIQPDSSVFIKPNLTWPDPRPGVTTSLPFIEALLAVLTRRALEEAHERATKR